MSTKLILPAIAITISIGLTQVLIPHLSRTATLTGSRRDNAFFTSPAYTSTLDPICQMQHTDKFLGCEDMHLVPLADKTFIFTACLSDYSNRKRVLSSQREADTVSRVTSGAKIPADKIYQWDLDSDEVVELELKGFPGGDDGGDRSFHGMDVNILPDGSLSLYIINHRLNGSVVEKFSYNSGTDGLVHIVTIPTKGRVAYPNDIYAVPHLDDINAFYVTDEHRYSTGLGRVVEDYTRRSWGSVHYHSTAGWKLAFPNVACANGLTGDKGNPGRVYISSLLNGEIIVTDEDIQEQGVLKELQRVSLGFMGDNPSLTASGADLFIAGFPTPQDLERHVLDPEGSSVGGMVARVSTKQLGSGFFGKEGGYTSAPIVDEVMVDVRGRWITASTTAVFREKVEAGVEADDEDEGLKDGDTKGLGDLYVTGLTSRGILKCKDMK